MSAWGGLPQAARKNTALWGWVVRRYYGKQTYGMVWERETGEFMSRGERQI